MAEAVIQEIHDDLEILKRDVSEIKEALFGKEGELSEWARARVDTYLKTGQKSRVSQQAVEKKFF